MMTNDEWDENYQASLVKDSQADRDRFAAQAMVAISSRWGGNMSEITDSRIEETCQLAYKMADAMLKARDS